MTGDDAVARSKLIVVIAAVAKNGVIGDGLRIPWRIPEDFAHFKRSTLHQTVLMGRTTFDSIGRPLPGRDTIVLSRNTRWNHPGVRVAHTLSAALELAEEMSGDHLMVAGGSHIYAEALAIAQMQLLSRIDLDPPGDVFYPHFDPAAWIETEREEHSQFSVVRLHKLPDALRLHEFEISSEAAQEWWRRDWATILATSVRYRERRSIHGAAVNWAGVHEATMRVIIEAAEQLRDSPDSEDVKRRQVRLSRRLSLQDLDEVQGALIHWSRLLALRPQQT